ncbi:hypothetical protein F2P56_013120 [Juglans regia]|uniref:Uncharacterized protein n=1 Tax=Juglans regia TaxID=51240 RepID=A0A834CVB4_JUGRE|nr:hypothetical protein F2P56_013120 [Juglans regia]
MLLPTAEQPYTTTPFHSTADHQCFDPSCDLLVVLENIIEHAAGRMEYLEKLEEKLSKAINVFSPLLCTIRQLLTNMDKVVVLSETVLEEIVKAFRELIFADDNLRPSLTEVSTNKLMEDPNALPMIQLWGTNGFAFFHPRDKEPQIPWSRHQKGTFPDFGIGPDATHKYTFYYGSNNEEWIEEFVRKATPVAKDLCIKAINISIEVCCILDPKRREEVRHLSKIVGTGKEDPHFLRHFKSRSDGRFVLTYNQSKVVLHDGGRKILKVLEEFQQWKNNVPLIGFEHSFIAHYHGKFPHYD